jgi:hypothetical protein
MARHSITVVHRTTGGSGSSSTAKTEKKDKKTSAKNEFKWSGLSNYNKQSTKNNKTFLELKTARMMGAIKAFATIEGVKAGINISTTIASAATGNEIRYNNMRVAANFLMNPVGFIGQVIPQQVLGELRVERQNRALEYQRQLTGNIAFSRKTSTGTF